LCASNAVGTPYDRLDIEELRKHGRKLALVEILKPEERARLGIISDPYGGKRRDPGPETQARAKEIVSAWDKYHADMERAKEESGVEAAQEAQDKALEEMDGIRNRIAQTRPRSLKGLLIKAQMAEIQPMSADGTGRDLEDTLTYGASTPQVLGLSLILDILHMNGGRA
jgi:hypothetical protein